MTHKIDGAMSPALRQVEAAASTSVQSRSGADRGQPVGATASADQMRLTGDATHLQALERELGAAPAGIDVAKVNAIRASLADGTYQVDAQAIAGRMLSLENALSK